MNELRRRAVLLTGVFGSGKTTIAAEMASILGRRSVNYAAIDLDWLRWFAVGASAEAGFQVMVENLRAVAANYVSAGVDHLVLALSIREQSELDAIRAAVPATLHVVQVTTPIDVIESRCEPDPTTGRVEDLRTARTWVSQGVGATIGDLAIDNDRPIGVVAAEIITWLGW